MAYVVKSLGKGARGLPIEAKIKALAAKLGGKSADDALAEVYDGRALPKKASLTLSGWKRQIQQKLDEENGDGPVTDECVAARIVDSVEAQRAKKTAKAKK
jgi:hypothetical protein